MQIQHTPMQTCDLIDISPKVSHEKNPPTFHYTGWLIGILMMVYYNPYITAWVVFHPRKITQPTRGPFFVAQVSPLNYGNSPT